MMYVEMGLPVSPVLFGTDVRGGESHGGYGGHGIVAADAGLETASSLLAKGMRPGHAVSRLDGSFVPRRRPATLNCFRKCLE